HLVLQAVSFHTVEGTEEALPVLTTLESLSITKESSDSMEEAVRSPLPLTPNITKLSLRNYSSSVNDSSEPDYRVGLLLEVDWNSSAPRFCKQLKELDLSGGNIPDELLGELMEFRKSTLKRIIRENPGAETDDETASTESA
ncbi:hypothetical protein FRB90_008368, partial [Tulasnella sp. 427]